MLSLIATALLTLWLWRRLTRTGSVRVFLVLIPVTWLLLIQLVFLLSQRSEPAKTDPAQGER